MDDYAGRVLANRYRLPLAPSDEEAAYLRAFDTHSGQEVLVRQVPLPEIVEAEVLDADGLPEGFALNESGRAAVARASDPAVRRAIEAAQAAAHLPDHPRLDQVFDVFADGGSLWIVSELVAGRPLSTYLDEELLSPYRAAEVAADILTGLRALHAHGWVHRNITARTVLVLDDGRVMLTGLAAGAAEEALCGYDPRPDAEPGGDPAATPRGHVGDGFGRSPGTGRATVAGPWAGTGPLPGPDAPGGPGRTWAEATGAAPSPAGAPGEPGPRLPAAGTDVRAARAGAIAAYRAGARAAARLSEEQRNAGLTPAPAEAPAPQAPHGRITDPYGVRSAPTPAPETPWHGALPRAAADTAPLPVVPDPLRVPAQPGSPAEPTTPPAGAEAPAGEWGERTGAPRRGPASALAAERARQARTALVGPVTERWAPEQAGPVHENWQLAAPIGPSTDLWALGALLFRAVQGHAPYPEDSTAELVQLVCAEPPAFAEECGPLRPVVESLLRQDPTERPDFEELRGWLRSLVRSAPEPDSGTLVVDLPPPDPRRLPIVRRRGELLRRRRKRARASEAPPRHRKRGQERPERPDAAPERPRRQKRAGRPAPARLGRTLLVLVMAGLAGVVAYALVFMPEADPEAGGQRTSSLGAGPTPAAGEPKGPDPAADRDAGADREPEESRRPDRAGTPVPDAAQPAVPDGFALRKDAEGFRVAVPNGWERQAKNASGQIVYTDGTFQLLLVPGRDAVSEYGSEPLAYMRESQRELGPFRDSTWSTSSGMRTIEVGGQISGEGQFTWTDSGGGELFVRNRAIIVDGRYHIVQMRGPEAERDQVTRLYEQAAATYQSKR
ncbi:protein kinase [Streptomyces sp. NPDC049906]|uniref:protein kinase domain-containing protein n=1 Tax=Streptomyces sp. NPDC049906 TaxID=3155656 RepID=UPI003439868E